ncbi:MAG TPA: hypothetical protein VKO45_06265, partial [Methanomicrobiales archaeon]|nr:hypothetical protein [Methanomicrobiales archaeon]
MILAALLQAVPFPAADGTPVINVPLLLFVFGVMSIVQSLVLGMKKMAYATGYCIGAVAGMALFFGLFAGLLTDLFPQIVPRASTATAG